jgi:hypothetical protein
MCRANHNGEALDWFYHPNVKAEAKEVNDRVKKAWFSGKGHGRVMVVGSCSMAVIMMLMRYAISGHMSQGRLMLRERKGNRW